MKSKILVGLSLGLAAVSYRYYVPIPKEFANRMFLGIGMGMQKFMGDMCRVVALFTGREASCVKGDMLERALGRDVQESPDIKIEDVVIAGVPVRIYTPTSAVTASQRDGGGSSGGGSPAVVFYHGGGFIYMSIRVYHTLITFLSLQSNTKFFSVGYRLAPEHLYPTALEDCERVTQHILHHSHQYQVNPHRIAIMGDSSGGNIAASVSQSLKSSTLQPKLQLLIYPILQYVDFQTPSYQQNGKSYLLMITEDCVESAQIYLFGSTNQNTTSLMLTNQHVAPEKRVELSSRFLNPKTLPKAYIPSNYVERKCITTTAASLPEQYELFLDPRVSSLLADDVTGLPTTYIYTAEYDVLRDEGQWYADRLRQAGVDVHHFHHQASYHGIMLGMEDVPQGRQCAQRVVDFIKEHL